MGTVLLTYSDKSGTVSVDFTKIHLPHPKNVRINITGQLKVLD